MAGQYNVGLVGRSGRGDRVIPNDVSQPEAEPRVGTRTLFELAIYKCRLSFHGHGHLSFARGDMISRLSA